MQWDLLLSEKRLGEDILFSFGDKYPITEMEKDYSRIISSASFRRLQDKTQVFPLDKSDFVRTRLTHSMETASIAKQLWTMIYANLERYQKNSIYKIQNKQVETISEALMCSGLLHDIGNPPFGHFGEFSIGNWFKNKLNDKNFTYKNKRIYDLLLPQMRKDLCKFEGNAQALRTLTKLHHVDSTAGLNLTSCVLNILIKYPTDSLNINNDDNTDIKYHKLGYYLADEDVYKTITHNTGTLASSNVYRHPLTFILEAADDIAYSTADLEDAFKKGLFSLKEFVDFFEDTLNIYDKRKKVPAYQKEKALELITPLKKMLSDKGSDSKSLLPDFQQWVGYARDWLTYAAAYGFASHYDEIMAGTYKTEIITGTNHEYTMKVLKDSMFRYVYPDPNIMKLELSAETIITSLLDKFIPAIMYFDLKDEEYKSTKSHMKYLGLISNNYIMSYEKFKTNDENYNLYLKFLLVTDFICGMTDSYAKTLYQELNGIN